MAPMEPMQALADLEDMSTEVEAAAVLDEEGAVVSSTLDAERSREIGRLTRELLASADGIRRRRVPSVTQVEVAMRAGSVFVVRAGGRAIVATTGPEPTSGLILYDLKSCLQGLAPDLEHAGAA